MTAISHRKRNPVSENTVRTYSSLLETWILPRLGSKDLKEVENGALRALVASVSDSLAPTSISQVQALVKAVVASAVDSNGNQLYPRTWNPDFIDAPVIKRSDLKAPVIAVEGIQEALRRSQGQEQALYSLLAGTGLRIGEALALRRDSWNPRTRIIRVDSTLLHGTGTIQAHPKTEAGVREVDVHPLLNEVLCKSVRPESQLLFTDSNRPLVYSTVNRRLRGLGITEALHAFRRFRATHLESQKVPRALIKYWMGHADSDITEGYMRMGKDLGFRRQECERAGLGFELPS